MSLTSRQVNALLASRISATAPETMGVAALVPPKLPLYRCPLSVVAILGLAHSPAAGRPAYPQVCAGVRVAASDVVVADGADGSHGIEVAVLAKIRGITD